MLDDLKRDLAELVAIPSISSPGYPEPRRAILDAFDFVKALFHDTGVRELRGLDLPDTAPVLVGEIPAPPVALDGDWSPRARPRTSPTRWSTWGRTHCCSASSS